MNAWRQMPSGRMVDLLRPDPGAIDFAVDIPVALARMARFGGAAGDPLSLRPWTVLDHSITGADLLAEHGRAAQLAFLLHDAHEAYLTDMPTPLIAALEHMAGEVARAGITALKAGWDRAIFQAAGIAKPSPELARLIHHHDLRLMMTERRDLMRPGFGGPGWGALERIKPLPDRLEMPKMPMPTRIVAFLDRLDRWAPQARARAGTDALRGLAERIGFRTEQDA